jgi:hypothetical protein
MLATKEHDIIHLKNIQASGESVNTCLSSHRYKSVVLAGFSGSKSPDRGGYLDFGDLDMIMPIMDLLHLKAVITVCRYFA